MPGLRRSARRIAGKPAERYGFGQAYILLHTNDNNKVPVSYKDALKRVNAENWIKASKEEFKSLGKLDTLELVKIPKGRNVIKTKWVFDLRMDINGTSTRHRARQVAKRFSQDPGIDFLQVFAPVCRYFTLRFMFALAAQY